MADTKIEWASKVWNPILGCSRCSPGCDHCYAIGVVGRQMSPQHVGLTIKRDGKPLDWTGELREVPHKLAEPLSWRKPQRVFVNSLSDLFHADVSDEYVAEVFAVMALCWHKRVGHQFQVLTKRPQRMAELVASGRFRTLVDTRMRSRWSHTPGLRGPKAAPWPLPNVWLGTSIESDRYAFRADHLRATPAAVRWISAEPLLGPLPSLDLTSIDWVVAGGESGGSARLMDPDWVRDLRDRCLSTCRTCGETLATPGHVDEDHVAFLFKQFGQHDEHGRKVGKKAAGRVLDGRTWDEYPAVPA